ncbi:DUF2490 domain-containing protein [Dyella sp. Tek66A03]|uniref:DUF2490 domain-containing protein n=1 Tax=Dyella sp. Tek66A03 TaxID=3458298 RepID=UPI00403E8248
MSPNRLHNELKPDSFCAHTWLSCTHLLPAACAIAALSLPSRVDARQLDLIPEAQVYVKMTDVMRLYMNVQVTSANPGGVTQTEGGVHLDITLTPLLRKSLREADWERDRYLWMRIGYETFGSPDNQEPGPSERRALVEMTVQAPLSQALHLWLVSRARVDFREIGSTFSRRYRYRLGVQQEITLSSGRTVVPYIRAETLYDTRYKSWNRQIYQAGAEIGLSHHWRIEPYLTRQNDSHSASANVDEVGLIIKSFW